MRDAWYFFSKKYIELPTQKKITLLAVTQVFAVRQVMEEMSRQVVTFHVDKLGHNVNIILLDILELKLCFLSVTSRIIRVKINNFM